MHEGPQRIAKTGVAPLVPGMIISNEPGYYAAGRFGIRIENLVIVEERNIAGAERVMFGFETITLAPIDLRLIERKLLDVSRNVLAQRLSRARPQGAGAACRSRDARLVEGRHEALGQGRKPSRG